MWLPASVRDKLAQPGTLRPLYWVLRHVAPVLQVGGKVFVTRHEDVCRVIQDSRCFSIVPINDAKMRDTTGHFILGMDAGPDYEREAGALRMAVRPEDPERVSRWMTSWAESRLAESRTAPSLDVVDGYFRPALAAWVPEYLGAPVEDVAVFLRQMRIIFWDIFLNLGDDPEIHDEAVRASAALRRSLDDSIARETARPSRADTILARLVALQREGKIDLGQEGIRRNVGGLVAGAVETVAKAGAQILDQLLANPDWMKQASAAAGGSAEPATSGSADELWPVLREALRFNPHNPLIVRQSTAACATSRSGSRLDGIAAGQTVFAATLSAMFDGRTWETPGRFDPPRPADQYLHFGGGGHPCFGRYLVPGILCSLFRPLLLESGLRRAPGPAGRLRYEGPFPAGLGIRLT
jgi:cytochrome P450